MNRRKFTTITGLSALSANAFSKEQAAPEAKTEAKPGIFKAKFAPNPNILPYNPVEKPNYLDKLKYAYDLGFRAWEDNWIVRQDMKTIEKIAEFARDHKIELGVCVITAGHGAKFNNITDGQWKKIKDDLKKRIEIAKITGQTNMTMLPGIRDESMKREDQIKASVDAMKVCCDIVEEHGIILAQEPLSHGISGGQPLLRSFEDGHLLCKLVNRKSCKLLADFFHEGQIGNVEGIVKTAEKVWDQVSYVQYGDTPGRKEPGTGKLDYVAITKFLRKKNFTGIIGMEHGASKKGQEGINALVDAYKKIDA